MYAEKAVMLARLTLETALWVTAPILVVAILVGLVISILQVMTSIQDTTVSTVPRLLGVAAATYFLMPWLLRKLVSFTAALFHDFRPYVG